LPVQLKLIKTERALGEHEHGEQQPMLPLQQIYFIIVVRVRLYRAKELELHDC
jgi:hypothetical protein